jgi:acetyl-CoA synthetase
MKLQDGAAKPWYAGEKLAFQLKDAVGLLAGDLDNAINGCVECCDRHVGDDKLALRCLSDDGSFREYTFEHLRDMSARLTNFFASQAIGQGDVIAGMLPHAVELVAAILGAWRMGAVYQPLFTAFGPKAIEHRLKMSNARLVVTDAANVPKFAEVSDRPLLAVVRNADEPLPGGGIDFDDAIAACSPVFELVMGTGTISS